MRHWLFLIVSGLFEVGWIVSLKLCEGFSRLLPSLFYALFGLGTAYFLSLSLKAIPMATAYAIWTAVSIAGAFAADVFLFKQPLGAFRLICAALVVAATCGLTFASTR
jgi:quaternary ammonium compound-resistance protein SugE